MKIALLEMDIAGRSATAVRGRAIRDFLVSRRHAVEVLSPPPDAAAAFERKRLSLRSRVARRLWERPTLPHFWDHLADLLEPVLRKGRYDCVLARGQDLGFVLTRLKGPLRIVDVANLVFLEAYYTWGPNLDEVEEAWSREMAVLRCADAIVMPHRLLAEYLVESVEAGASLAPRIVVAPLGCEPALRTARWADSPRIVYAGSYHYIQDPWLLSLLTKTSPLEVDCYGPRDPNRRFLPTPLRYKGYAPSMDFLADYQFGLITLSRDRLRQFSPSTKLPYYLSHGLPVLFPAWMREGHAYPDCALPYDEDDFADVVARVATRERWSAMSQAALIRARSLGWQETLAPLADWLTARSPGP